MLRIIVTFLSVMVVSCLGYGESLAVARLGVEFDFEGAMGAECLVVYEMARNIADRD